MRVAKMGYAQRVTKRDKKGRVTSSFERVRIVVPDGLPPSLPAPYTGHKNLTKKVHSDREHAEWTARFLAMIDEARGWTTIHRELAEIDGLSHQGFITRGSIPVFAKLDRKMDEILGEPIWKKITAHPVIFSDVIPKWAKHTNAGPKGVGDMTYKTDRFVRWLGHDDMMRVTFQNAREYRDAKIAEIDAMFEDLDEPEDLIAYRAKRKTLSNHLKAIQALFNFAAKYTHLSDDGQPTVNPIAGVDFNPGEGNQRDDFTPEDRRMILILARHAEPHIYWLNWLGSDTGARLSELADAHTRDVVQIEGVWVIRIHTKNRSRDQRLKTFVSTRDVPLHAALLDEDFLEYVASIGDGPLFPQLRLDGYGRRAGQASTEISDWLRKVVKITDPPSHGIRIVTLRPRICVIRWGRMARQGLKRTSNTTFWGMAARVVRARMAATESVGWRPCGRRLKSSRTRWRSFNNECSFNSRRPSALVDIQSLANLRRIEFQAGQSSRYTTEAVGLELSLGIRLAETCGFRRLAISAIVPETGGR